MLRIRRTPDTFEGAGGVEGRRLYVLADHLDGCPGLDARLVVPAIERGGEYVRAPPGRYTGRMAVTRLASGHQHRVIRLLDVPVRPGETTDSILVHVANWPHQLTGCVGPGLEWRPDGVGSSRLAMEAIFAVLGGFHAGREFCVHVEELEALRVDV